LNDREKNLKVAESQTPADMIFRRGLRHNGFLYQVKVDSQFCLYPGGRSFAIKRVNQNGVDIWPNPRCSNDNVRERRRTPGSPAYQLSTCRDLCQKDAPCKAWTWVKPGVQNAKAMCWLKNAIPTPSADANTTSGVKVSGDLGVH
jgi:hypothetical protein